MNPTLTLLAALALVVTANAQVPSILNYQGRVSIGGSNYNGNGQFKFALVNADGSATYWNNAGTTSAEPASSVSLVVTQGLYSTILGDTATANMAAIPAGVFTNNDLRLRVWFRAGTNGAFMPFAPDQRLGSAPYALAASAVRNAGATGLGSFVGGGEQNTANTTYATVSGGSLNSAIGYGSTVGGGGQNTASNNHAAVGGGFGNTASASLAFVGGGRFNDALADFATISGGERNTNSGRAGFIGGGSNNSVPAGASNAVVVGGSGNTATGNFATVAGGQNNAASDNFAAVAGGNGNSATGIYSFVGGGNQNTTSDDWATVGGGDNNTAASWATVGGGQNNAASGSRAAVGGGSDNSAVGNQAVVAGGSRNTAGGARSAVGGGDTNIASGDYATVAGGLRNTANGMHATIPGGVDSKATNRGSFVWSGEAGVETVSTNNYSFTVRARGGARFITTTNTDFSDTNIVNGVQLLPNETAWTVLSDRATKTNFAAIDKREVLAKLASLPVSSWSYKHDPARRYIGPTAQDFLGAFHLGHNDKGINTLDADGVAFAAIQGLVEELQTRDARIERLENDLKEIRRELGNLPPSP